MPINITIERLQVLAAQIKEANLADPANLKNLLSLIYIELLNATSTGKALIAKLPTGGKVKANSQIIGGELNVLLPETTKAEKADIYKLMDEAQNIWAEIPVVERARVLNILKGKLNAASEYFKMSLMLEIGKPAKTSISEIEKSVEYFEFFTSTFFIKALSGEVLDKGPEKIITTRKPRGKTGVIASANYPLALSMPGILSGLMTGNSVITKPTGKAMLWSFAFKELLNDSIIEWASKTSFALTEMDLQKLMNGLFQIALGYKLDFYKDVNALFFVGSEDTGKEVRLARFEHKINYTAVENGTDIMEYGGIAPAIIMKSKAVTTQNIENLANEIWAGATGASGQRCTATKIAFIETEVDESLVDSIYAKAENLDKNGAKIDMPFVDGAEFGPIFDVNVIEQIKDLKKLAQTCGLKNIGGNPLSWEERKAGGKYITPLVIDISPLVKEALVLSDNEKKLVYWAFKKEVFGPVLFIVEGFKNLAEVTELCRRIDQPLAAGFYGTDSEFVEFRAKTEFGSINHNKTAKDLSPLGNHGARQRSGGSMTDYHSIIEANTFAVSTRTESAAVADKLLGKEAEKKPELDSKGEFITPHFHTDHTRPH